MKYIILILLILVFSLPGLTWGPVVHTRIANRIIESGTFELDENAFKRGNVLPDMSLAIANLRKDNDKVWMERQHYLHQETFVSAMLLEADTPELESFAYGWLAHLAADEVESVYTEDKISQGAPEGADWAVDTFYDEKQKIELTWAEKGLIQAALGDYWKVSNKDWKDIEKSYNGYFTWREWAFANRKKIAKEWYSDYGDYVVQSISNAVKAIEEIKGDYCYQELDFSNVRVIITTHGEINKAYSAGKKRWQAVWAFSEFKDGIYTVWLPVEASEALIGHEFAHILAWKGVDVDEVRAEDE